MWDVAQGGEPIVQYPFSAPNFQRDVAFLPDSRQILVAGADGTAIVDIASGARVGQIAGAHPPIAVSPRRTDARRGARSEPGSHIGLFDLTSGQRERDFWPGTGSGSSVWRSAPTAPGWHPAPMTTW